MESKADDNIPPSAAKLVDNGSYNQTYIILRIKDDIESKTSKVDGNETLFRCGNWCYNGLVQFGSLKLCSANLPGFYVVSTDEYYN